MIKKSFMLLFLFACSSISLFSQDVEQELAFLQEIFGDCLAESTADDFADLDELYMFVEINCQDGPWMGDTTNWEPSVEEEFAWMQIEFAECFADYTADDFATVDELYMFLDTNCFDEPGDPWGGDTTNWEPSVEEEFAWMQLEFGDCLADYTADDFANVDELYIFVETTCFGDDPWIDDTTNWEISVEDELLWMQDYYGECLEGVTADDFTNIDELYNFVWENCDEPDPWEPSLEEEFAWLQSCYEECLANSTADDFASIDELYAFVEENCEDTYNDDFSVEGEFAWMEVEFADCLEGYTADDFATVDDLYIFVETNCFGDDPWIDDSTNWEISVEEEFAWMQLEFGDCLADYTADDFANVDDLYIFVETNCFEPWTDDSTTWEISVEEEFAWMQIEFGDCLANSTADDFANVEELYMFVEMNCFGDGLPEEGGDPNVEDANESAAANTTIGLDKINNGINMSNAQLVLQELDLSNISLVLIDSRGKILEELELEETIKVYPNPTTDFINIDVQKLGVETVQLYDLKGALVKDITISIINGVYQLDVSDLATNMYVLQMTTAKGVVVERIQVVR